MELQHPPLAINQVLQYNDMPFLDNIYDTNTKAPNSSNSFLDNVTNTPESSMAPIQINTPQVNAKVNEMFPELTRTTIGVPTDNTTPDTRPTNTIWSRLGQAFLPEPLQKELGISKEQRSNRLSTMQREEGAMTLSDKNYFKKNPDKISPEIYFRQGLFFGHDNPYGEIGNKIVGSKVYQDTKDLPDPTTPQQRHSEMLGSAVGISIVSPVAEPVISSAMSSLVLKVATKVPALMTAVETVTKLKNSSVLAEGALRIAQSMGLGGMIGFITKNKQTVAQNVLQNAGMFGAFEAIAFPVQVFFRSPLREIATMEINNPNLEKALGNSNITENTISKTVFFKHPDDPNIILKVTKKGATVIDSGSDSLKSLKINTKDMPVLTSVQIDMFKQEKSPYNWLVDWTKKKLKIGDKLDFAEYNDRYTNAVHIDVQEPTMAPNEYATTVETPTPTETPTTQSVQDIKKTAEDMLNKGSTKSETILHIADTVGIDKAMKVVDDVSRAMSVAVAKVSATPAKVVDKTTKNIFGSFNDIDLNNPVEKPYVSKFADKYSQEKSTTRDMTNATVDSMKTLQSKLKEAGHKSISISDDFKGIYSLNRIINNDKLFEKYPALRKVNVIFANFHTPSKKGLTVGNDIFINSKIYSTDKTSALSTLVHEIQHIKQNIRGVAGNEGTSFKENYNSEREVEERRKQQEFIKSSEKTKPESTAELNPFIKYTHTPKIVAKPQDSLIQNAKRYETADEFVNAVGKPKTINVFIKTPISKSIVSKDVPVVLKVDNVTMYRCGDAKGQFWTTNKKYAEQFGDLSKRTGTFYEVFNNSNKVIRTYVTDEYIKSQLTKIWEEAHTPKINEQTKKIEEQVQLIKDTKSYIDDMESTVSAMPGKELKKFVSRQTGELPEVGAKSTANRNRTNSKFAKHGDIIAQEILGQEISKSGDVAVSQQHVDDYNNALRNLNELKEGYKQQKLKLKEMQNGDVSAEEYDEYLKMTNSTIAKLREKITAVVVSSNATKEGVDFLNDVKNRLNIDFDVHILNKILIGNKDGAWGVTYDNSIGIVKNMEELTAHHEFVHLILGNMKGIDAFNGMTAHEVLSAQAEKMGIKLNASNEVSVEEQLAYDFEDYVKGNRTAKGKLRRFFNVLIKIVRKIIELFKKTKGNVINDFYDTILYRESVSKQMKVFANKGLMKSFIDNGIIDVTNFDSPSMYHMIKLDISKVHVSSFDFNNAKKDIAMGRGSKTNGDPIITWVKSRKRYEVLDGNHRIVQMMKDGKKKIWFNVEQPRLRIKDNATAKVLILKYNKNIDALNTLSDKLDALREKTSTDLTDTTARKYMLAKTEYEQLMKEVFNQRQSIKDLKKSDVVGKQEVDRKINLTKETTRTIDKDIGNVKVQNKVRLSFKEARIISNSMRDTSDIDTRERRILRKKITNKLYGEGAKVKGHRADIVLGLPAGGKSSALATPLEKEHGSLIIDSDMAKEMLPEYANGLGAQSVHNESSYISTNVYNRAVKNGDNIVLPLVGRNTQKIKDLIDSLTSKGYSVHLHHVSVSVNTSKERAISRFNKTGRFVDTRYIEGLGLQPKETYDKLKRYGKENRDKKWQTSERTYNERVSKNKGGQYILHGRTSGGKVVSYSEYSNEVPYGEKPKLIEKGINDNSEVLYRGDASKIDFDKLDTVAQFNQKNKEALSAFSNTPGIYFTTSEDNAKSYGENITTVSIKRNANIINIKDARKALSRRDVENIIRSNPDIADVTTNYSEDFEKGLSDIVDNIMAEKDGNEFLKAIWAEGGFSNKDFTIAMTDAGIDGVKVAKDDVTHYVIYNKSVLSDVSMAKNKDITGNNRVSLPEIPVPIKPIKGVILPGADYVATFIEKDIINPVKNQRKVLKEIWNFVKYPFVDEPIIVQKASAITGSHIMETEKFRSTAWKIAEESRNWWAKIPSSIHIDIINNIDNGTLEPKDFIPQDDGSFSGITEEMAGTFSKLAKAYRIRMDKQYEFETNMGVRVKYLKDYFPHMWDDTAKAKIVFGNYARTMSSGRFTKERFIKLIKYGYDNGLELRTTNLEELVTMREIDGYRIAQELQLIKEFEKIGLAFPTDTKGLDTYSIINTPDARQVLVPQEVAKILDRSIFADNMWSMKGFFPYVFRNLMRIKGIFVPIKLSLSGFHLVHITFIATSDSRKLIYKKILKSNMNGISAMKELGKSTSFVSQGEAIKKYGIGTVGTKGLWQADVSRWWDTPMDKLEPYQRQTIQYIIDGGGTPKVSEEFAIRAKDSFINAINEENYIGATIRGIPKLIEGYQKPIFESYIPALKVASYIQSVDELLKRKPELATDDVQRRIEFHELWKSVDNRFGQMNYKTLFWNPMVKQWAQVAFLSLGWNLGFVREFGGGSIELAKLIGKGSIRRATKEDLTDKILFSLDYILQAVIIGGLMTYAMTGDRPRAVQDFFFPRTGGTNPDGSPARVNTSFYTREYFSALNHYRKQGTVGGSTALVENKLNPVLSTLSDIYNNKDYYGYQIRDTNSPIMVQSAQFLDYMMKNALAPISLAGAIRASSVDGKKGVFLSFAGFNPAPKYIAESQMESKIYSILDRRTGGVKPLDSKIKSDSKSNIRRLYLSGKIKEANVALDNAIKAGYISPRGKRSFIRTLDIPSDVRAFGALSQFTSDQRHLLSNMTEKELERYAGHASLKLRHILSTLSPTAKQFVKDLKSGKVRLARFKRGREIKK